jgi:hypothetical protein
VTEREELARIIDPSSWLVLDSYLAEVKRKHPNSGYDPDNFKDRESLAKADQWLSRPSPVDGLKASLDEATSATMMAEMRADKLMAENARLREVVAELERQMEHTFPIEWVDVPRKPKFPPTSQET